MCFETIAANNVSCYIYKPNCVIVDLRDASDYIKGHIPSAINIPCEDLNRYVSYLSQYEEIVLYCSRGNNSMLAARSLSIPGARVMSLYGGIRAYRGEIQKGQNNI